MSGGAEVEGADGPGAEPEPTPPAPAPDPEGIDLGALETYVDLEQPRFDLADVERMSGLDADQLSGYWRALGFPEPREGEKLLTERDVEMLSTVVTFIADGSLDPEIALQMARVIGAAVDRIAAAQVDALVARLAETRDDGDAEELRRTVQLANLMPRILEFVWRRQLAGAARRRLLRSASPGAAAPVCVGFADLVGFTAQTQQLDQAQLARVVGRFEAIAYDVVRRHGARVVKTIGDEVMFLADDPRSAADLALDLARTYRDDPDLSDVRVGLAYGPVLEKDGDIYGHTVNLASRIVSIAYPGSVVVSAEVADALGDDDEFDLSSLRNHYLKDIGRVPLWRLRRADDVVEGAFRAEEVRRSARHRILAARWRERDQAIRERAAGELGPSLHERVDQLPARLAGVLSGTASPEEAQDLLDNPTPEELEAIADVVLEADIDAELRLDLLTDIGAAQTLRELDREATRKADEADEEAERRLREIEAETARRIAQVEDEARRKVEAAIEKARDESRKVDVEAARRVEKVVQEAYRKADQAQREARARAARQAQRRKKRNR